MSNFKSQLTSLANALRKTGLTLSSAFKRAWEILKLKVKMLTEPVEFSYTKEKGEERKAIGFFGAAPETVSKPDTKPAPILAIRYFDLEANN